MDTFHYAHTLFENQLGLKYAIGVVLGETEGLSFLLYDRFNDAGAQEFISSVSIDDYEKADRLYCKRIGRMSGKGWKHAYAPKLQTIAFGEYLFDNKIGEAFPYHSFKPIIREYERLLGMESLAERARPEYELMEGFGAF